MTEEQVQGELLSLIQHWLCIDAQTNTPTKSAITLERQGKSLGHHLHYSLLLDNAPVLTLVNIDSQWFLHSREQSHKPTTSQELHNNLNTVMTQHYHHLLDQLMTPNPE